MAADVDTQPRPLGLLIVSGILAALPIYAALRTGNLMEALRERLVSLGSTIPPLTEFVLGWPNFWWLIVLPALAVFIWIARRSTVTRTERTRMKLAVLAVLLFGAALYGLVLYAVYSPMWALGQTV